MNHCFNKEIADNFGLNIATFLQSVAYWTHNNLTNKHHLIESHCWTYNTLEALLETFTYWTKSQLETVINNSIKAGLLIKGNFNQTKYDRTCWYALSHEAYKFFPDLCGEHFFERLYDSISEKSEIEYANFRNRFPANRTPIPITKPVTKKNTISDNAVIEEIKAVYHEELPELPKVKKVDSKLRSQLNRMVKEWPTYQKEGKEFSIESFRDYVLLLKKHYSWFLEPYKTESGNQVKSSLRKITRELNITRIVNGEFSAN